MSTDIIRKYINILTEGVGKLPDYDIRVSMPDALDSILYADGEEIARFPNKSKWDSADGRKKCEEFKKKHAEELRSKLDNQWHQEQEIDRPLDEFEKKYIRAFLKVQTPTGKFPFKGKSKEMNDFISDHQRYYNYVDNLARRDHVRKSIYDILPPKSILDHPRVAELVKNEHIKLWSDNTEANRPYWNDASDIEEMLKNGIPPTKEELVAYVKNSGDKIKNIVNAGIIPSEAVQIAAVRDNRPYAMPWIKNPTPKVIALSDKMKSMGLDFWPAQWSTDDL